MGLGLAVDQPTFAWPPQVYVGLGVMADLGIGYVSRGVPPTLSIGPIGFTDIEILEGIGIAWELGLQERVGKFEWGIIGNKDSSTSYSKYFHRTVYPSAQGAGASLLGRKIVEALTGGKTIYDLAGV